MFSATAKGKRSGPRRLRTSELDREDRPDNDGPDREEVTAVLARIQYISACNRGSRTAHSLDTVLNRVHFFGRPRLVQVAHERPDDNDLHDAGEDEEWPDADVGNALVRDESRDDHEHVDLSGAACHLSSSEAKGQRYQWC